MGKTAKDDKTDRLHLTAREVEKLIDAATESSRNRERDRCLVLLSFRHGYRVSEICALPLDHVDIESRVLHVKRLKIRAGMKLPATVKAFFVSETSG
jgi:site-specific recombinase XerD